MGLRQVTQIIPGLNASDGAGVKLRRSLGQHREARLDPFLMLDAFSSENPDDYIAGFPPHPHRGFETVTYMLDGRMLHEDHLGNRGELRAGGAQWMTAGRGIIHSEMPQQVSGRLRGFQLWINLPAREKMKPAHYRDIAPEEIPGRDLPEGGHVRVLAGAWQGHGQGETLAGPIQGLSTRPLFLDVALPPGGRFFQALPEEDHAFVYPFEGDVRVGDRPIAGNQAGILSLGDGLQVEAGPSGARFILLAARPLGEPVAQYGPFVMNTREEVEQAIQDYQQGVLTGDPREKAFLG